MRKRFINQLLPIILAFSGLTIENVNGAIPGFFKIPDHSMELSNSSNPASVSGCDSVFPEPISIRSASITNTDLKKGEILVNFNTSQDIYRKGYIVYRSVNNGAYKAIDTLFYSGKGIYQYFDNGLNTVNNTFSYYLRIIDSCENISEPSDTHSVAHLMITPQNQVNVLTWNSYKGFNRSEYEIFKKAGNSGWKRIAVINSDSNTYHDSNVHCGMLYTYQILTFNTLSGTDSAFSNSDTGRAFKTTPPLAPKIINATITVTSNTLGQILINWYASTSADVEKYIIYRRQNGTQWQKIASIPGTDYSYTDININTHSWPYYYKIIAIDSCGNTSDDNNIFHRTVNLKASPGNEIIKLNWNTYWGFISNKYELYKNGKYLKTFDSTVTSFTDSLIHCPNSYNYVICTVGKDTSAWSNRDSAAPTDSIPPLPPIIKSVSVKIPNNIIRLSWLPSISSDAFGYKIFRIANQDISQMIIQRDSMDSVYTDTISQDLSPGCYEIISYDHCGNSSNPSNLGCVINLNGNAKNLENDLSWNKYIFWSDNVSYYNIYRNTDNDGWISMARIPASENKYIDRDLSINTKRFCYKVEAVETSGNFNETSWSTEICLSQPPIVYFPTAFTPNYSFNLNDYFGPKGAYFSTYKMKIFDRWGEMVYKTDTGQPWDGTYKKGHCLSGLYQYQIEIYGYDGNNYEFRGTIKIID